MNRPFFRYGLAVGLFVLIMPFQSCGPATYQKGASSSSSVTVPEGGGGGGGENDVETGVISAAQARTLGKPVGTPTVKTMIQWDLGGELQTSVVFAGARLRMSVLTFRPPDGSPDVYYVSEPTITTGARALQVRGLRVNVNGVLDELTTTFTGLDLLLAPNTTTKLSNATLIHQLDQMAAPTDTLGVTFEVLWPADEPLPTVTPGVLTSAQLYAKNCANCHGALSNSAKQGRTAFQITSAFDAIPTMRYLKTSLTPAQVSAIALALGTN